MGETINSFIPILTTSTFHNYLWLVLVFCVRSNIFREHSWYAIWFSNNQRNMPIFITGTWHFYFLAISWYKVIWTINRICTLYEAILSNPWIEVFPINLHLIFLSKYLTMYLIVRYKTIYLWKCTFTTGSVIYFLLGMLSISFFLRNLC